MAAIPIKKTVITVKRQINKWSSRHGVIIFIFYSIISRGSILAALDYITVFDCEYIYSVILFWSVRIYSR